MLSTAEKMSYMGVNAVRSVELEYFYSSPQKTAAASFILSLQVHMSAVSMRGHPPALSPGGGLNPQYRSRRMPLKRTGHHLSQVRSEGSAARFERQDGPGHTRDEAEKDYSEPTLECSLLLLLFLQ